MVRKRSRTSRKHYDSDDNDSDSDFALEDPRSQPAPKKYSLRQRKKALFIDDYDYEDDDEILPIPPTTVHSDDEDFDVEREVCAPESEYDASLAYTNEDPSEDPNGLIDFEDMIRADIVVNKNRIDYDNMIDKTEITIQPNKSQSVPPVKSKRGRKPKKRPETEIGSILLEPQTEVQEEIENKTDTNNIIKETVQISPQKTQDNPTKETVECLDNQISEKKEENEMENEETQSSKDILTPQIEETENGDTEQLNVDSQESVIKFNENCISKSIHINGTVLTTDSVELSEAKDDSNQNNIESDDDDDVVFVEDKRSEIIVLDD